MTTLENDHMDKSVQHMMSYNESPEVKLAKMVTCVKTQREALVAMDAGEGSVINNLSNVLLALKFVLEHTQRKLDQRNTAIEEFAKESGMMARAVIMRDPTMASSVVVSTSLKAHAASPEIDDAFYEGITRDYPGLLPKWPTTKSNVTIMSDDPEDPNDPDAQNDPDNQDAHKDTAGEKNKTVAEVMSAYLTNQMEN